MVVEGSLSVEGFCAKCGCREEESQGRRGRYKKGGQQDTRNKQDLFDTLAWPGYAYRTALPDHQKTEMKQSRGRPFVFRTAQHLITALGYGDLSFPRLIF